MDAQQQQQGSVITTPGGESPGQPRSTHQRTRPSAMTPNSPSNIPQPRTPQSAHTLRTMILPIHHSRSHSTSHMRTPLSAQQPPSSSLQALLEARTPLRSPQPEALGEDKWRRLGARILPLFHGDGLQGAAVEETIEALRGCLVRSTERESRAEIQAIVRAGMPSVARALYKHLGVKPRLEPRSGVATVGVRGLVAEDSGVSAEALVEALAAVWEGLVWAHVLPYLEAVFLPLVQRPLTAHQYHRAPLVDVRKLLLAQVRDAVVAPVVSKLDGLTASPQPLGSLLGPQWMRSLAVVGQMLAVLAQLAPTDRQNPVYLAAKNVSMLLAQG